MIGGEENYDIAGQVQLSEIIYEKRYNSVPRKDRAVIPQNNSSQASGAVHY